MRASRMLSRLMIGAAALFLGLGCPQPAEAKFVVYEIWFGDDDDDHHRIEFFVDDEDPKLHMNVVVNKDGSMSRYIWQDGNPSPDGTDTGLKPDKTDAQARLERALQKGGEWAPTVEFWETKIGKGLTAKGKGPSVIDPTDDDRGGPTGTGAVKEKLKQVRFHNELELEPGEYGSSKGGFDFDAGSPKQQAQGKKHSPGKKNNDSSDKDPPPDFVDPAMQGIGPPELVNPAPEPVTKSRVKKVVAKGLAKKLGRNGPVKKAGTLALGGPDTKPALGGPDTKQALGGPDTKSAKRKLVGTGLLDDAAGLASHGPLGASAPKATLRMR